MKHDELPVNQRSIPWPTSVKTATQTKRKRDPELTQMAMLRRLEIGESYSQSWEVNANMSLAMVQERMPMMKQEKTSLVSKQVKMVTAQEDRTFRTEVIDFRTHHQFYYISVIVTRTS